MVSMLKQSLWVIAALVAVILLPVALRSHSGGRQTGDKADETLVIVSPHN